ncbi:hypothetical protein ATI61_106307 [Archangium gephyra]|uniref:Uncharacterized protein n=1 Tax=Archangium gephyra TaxID=48 RepID=A0AAC8Q179_9BACT|nr:hypothetical protein [Archangium gephyra]AKI98926.1 Hypothetical protein AA314_00553 [Archangium gephyra]REG30837.1 hypothetical protein ATI61_106307 [Archangium gephyra]
MRHEAHIREQAGLARRLSAERSHLFEQVPFARELERGEPELKRITRPVVAVAGPAGVGKSTLLRALGADVPWKWLEVESGGAGEEGGLSVGELAEHCLLVLTAGEAPSREVLAWLPRLAEEFPEGSLQIVLTRGEALPEERAAAARAQLEPVLREVVPQRTLPVFTVSGTTGEGLEALRAEVAEKLAWRQRVLLEEALKDWSGVLADVHALLGMRDLAKLRPETLTRLRLSLDELLREESQRLEGELPRLAEEGVRELESRLPEAQRSLTRAFREKLSARVEPRSHALRQRLDEVLARELARDLEGKSEGKAHLELANRFGRLVEPRSLFFDWGLARTGGVAGVGAAMAAGVARKHGGWAVLGAALLGGVLAGLLGRGTKVNTAEELKRVVAEPLVEESLRRLKEATESSRADVERLCGLLRKVAEIFSPEQARAYDVEGLGQAVTQAEGRREQLGRELTELRWKDARA